MVALAVTCVLAFPTLMQAVQSASALGPGANGKGGPGMVAGQVAMSGVEAGACMSFQPKAGAAGKTVFIDPGHGGLDPGVVGMVGQQQVQEKDVALGVGLRLSSLLRGDGYRVVMSRTQDSSVTRLSAADSVTGAMTASAVHRDLVTRAACANAAASSVLVSIHFDAFDDPSVGGTETFYDAQRAFAAENKRLAADLQKALVSGLGSTDRGVWTDDQLAAPTLTASGSLYGHLIELGPPSAGYVDNPSQMPGALVEPLFLTNPAEAKFVSSTLGQQRVAAALELGLQKYFSGA